MIQIQNVSRIYQPKKSKTSVVAIEDVSLDLFEDESVAITGRSGSGKTTLLHILGGMDRPNIGKVLYGDTDLYAMKDKDLAHFRNKTVGFVFQASYLEPSFSALENVALALLLPKVPSAKRMRIAAEALEKVGLEHRLTHKPNELSGGEKQRVCVARAIVNAPTILLADEPTGNLDEQTGREIMKLLREVTAHCCLILATHDIDEAKNMSRRIIMRDGKVDSDIRKQKEAWHVQDSL